MPALAALLSYTLFVSSLVSGTPGYGTKNEGHYNDHEDVSAEGDAVNHPGMDGTSKACR